MDKVIVDSLRKASDLLFGIFKNFPISSPFLDEVHDAAVKVERLHLKAERGDFDKKGDGQK